MSGDRSRIEWEEVCRVVAAAQILQHTPEALSYAQARAHGMAWTDDLNAKWIAWQLALQELRDAVEKLEEGDDGRERVEYALTRGTSGGPTTKTDG